VNLTACLGQAPYVALLRICRHYRITLGHDCHRSALLARLGASSLAERLGAEIPGDPASPAARALCLVADAGGRYDRSLFEEVFGPCVVPRNGPIPPSPPGPWLAERALLFAIGAEVVLPDEVRQALPRSEYAAPILPLQPRAWPLYDLAVVLCAAAADQLPLDRRNARLRSRVQCELSSCFVTSTQPAYASFLVDLALHAGLLQRSQADTLGTGPEQSGWLALDPPARLGHIVHAWMVTGLRRKPSRGTATAPCCDCPCLRAGLIQHLLDCVYPSSQAGDLAKDSNAARSDWEVTPAELCRTWARLACVREGSCPCRQEPGVFDIPIVGSGSGRYGDTGTCSADHGAAGVGATGPAGASIDPVTGYSLGEDGAYGDPTNIAKPGQGGGQLTLIAGTVSIQGRLKADGGAGQNAFNVEDVDGPETWSGAGGGSGGGITVSAQHLVLAGSIAAVGGADGRGSGRGTVDGPHGSGGCIKVFAGQIDSVQSTLAISGSVFVDSLNPADPVPPPAQTGSATYDATTHHTLAQPFLGYWRTHGGVVLLGHPLSEAFTEHGVLQQYTERALLQVVHGRVQPAALGTLLTVDLHLARVSHAAPGSRYFPATGHTLGGPFLAYWLAHQGTTLLGAPLSEVIDVDAGSGGAYQLQWFERGRLEYHRNLAAPYQMQLGLVGRDALRARGWLPAALPAAATQLVATGPGRVAGAKLYALASNGDLFESDGSAAWHYIGGTIADPAQCWVYGIATTGDGNTIYLSSAANLPAGGGPPQGSCTSLWHGVDGALQPVPSSMPDLWQRFANQPQACATALNLAPPKLARYVHQPRCCGSLYEDGACLYRV